jgi:hypothetical protein
VIQNPGPFDAEAMPKAFFGQNEGLGGPFSAYGAAVLAVRPRPARQNLPGFPLSQPIVNDRAIGLDRRT